MGALEVSSLLVVRAMHWQLGEVMILPGIWTCRVTKEAEPSCFNDTWNWRTAGSHPDRSIGNVPSVWDPKDFSERPCVKGIQSSSKSLCDSWCFQSIHQHQEDIGLIQPDLCVHQDIWLPNMLLQQHHTILGNTNALEWQRMLKDTMIWRIHNLLPSLFYGCFLDEPGLSNRFSSSTAFGTELLSISGTGFTRLTPFLSPNQQQHGTDPNQGVSEWVSWSLTSLFSTNTAISEMKGQGWKVIRTQWRKASDILTSTLAFHLWYSRVCAEKGR